MPLDLTNAPATFQHIMNQMFQDLLYKCVMVYLDDILVFSDSVKQHLADLRKVFERLCTLQFKAKHQKCEFGKCSVEYLGHVVENSTVYAYPNKVSAVRTWPKPTNVKEVLQFMGLANYYAQYIRNFADIAAPLMHIMSHKHMWERSEPQEHAF